ncbi:hypothetical protein M9Y10_030800 [Tritrichomonas musculus]|uniref:Protein kinase domain-containing protein n=1 Tax=Tritrichomonas musculus TaxID=1915356 RepID=A0ABR2H301_9EUKA
MQQLSFQELPLEYISMLNKIIDDKLKSIYSKFSFKYLNYISALDISNEDQIKKLLFDYLTKFKFIVYQILEISSDVCQSSNTKVQNSNEEDSDHSLNSISSKIDIVFCVEGQCIIIEKIDLSIIKRIISNFNEYKCSLIDVSTNKIEEEDIKKGKEVKEEINNFCRKFESCIKNNEFVSQTISPIAGYLIRRYFYPSVYFSDKTFFYFDDAERIEQQKLITEFMSFLSFEQPSQTEDDDLTKNWTKNKRDLTNFETKDFIILRTIYSDDKSFYYLAIHIESLHILLIKKFSDSECFAKEKGHEIYFCENFSHRCLTRCYGFIKENNQTTGVIYKFMSNGSLSLHVSSNRDKIDDTFSILTISRVIQGLDYLHASKLIHRDLKPANILLDHDFLPYISDFDEIRNPNEGEEESDPMTANVGSTIYMSPEQYRGENVSYSSDIYSFGLLIYFLYEKKDLYRIIGAGNYIKNENEIPKLSQASDTIQTLFSKCLELNTEERIAIQDIKYIYSNNIFPMLFKNLNKSFISPQSAQLMIESFIIFDNFVQIKEKNEALSLLLSGYDLNDIIGLLYEQKQDYNKAKEYYELSAQQNDSLALNILGLLYKNGFGVKQDYNKAKEYYELSAQQNNSDALNNLGHLYYNGHGVKQDYNKAKEYYELSAQQNNSGALNNLGNLYKNGFGVKQDYNKAKEYYELSAQQNDLYALNNLGNLYKNGFGVKQDYNKAKEYYELSAQQNNSDALNNLGHLYYNGFGVKQDYNKAKEYYELSAQQNNSGALNNLGLLYKNGFGVKQDYNKAKEYYELSAQQNDLYALNNLGNLYYNGFGVKQDYNKAKEYYELSAQQNDSDALNNLGHLYYNGHGVKQDYNKAKEYYELSAQQNDSYALNNLGNLYYNGFGVKQDYNKAKEYLELSAQQNNSGALNNLGNLYYNGFGVKQDYNKAKEYYELSAQQNDSYALNNLGNLYYNGFGVKQDYNKAKEYLELSAQQNNSGALNNLGLLYYNGHGVKQDYNKAKEYYELSAQQNDSYALNNLGLLYENGLGVKQDYNKAKEYYELSAQQNDSYALNNLGNLYKNGFGVKQDYNKAKEYYELSAQQNNSGALNNLGLLYYNGFGVKQDYNKAKEYFELLIKGNNKLAYLNMGHLYRKVKDYSLSMKYYQWATLYNYSDAFCKIGNLYLKGRGVEKNYLKAKDFYEQSADKNNSNALIKLGNLYYYGQGVKQDYCKAKEYYELSGRQGNSKALFKLGKLYFEGQGVERNYEKAEEYYKMSSYINNPDGLFFLGVFYSRGDILEVNIPLAVQYFLKSTEIHYGQARVDNNADHTYMIKNIYNNYYYHSQNDLGLIYLTFYKDIENATKYIKEAAFGEYPFGQNNFGLLNEIYLNEIGNAEYMYQRSSKHNFALAFYNLGHLKEKEIQKNSEERKDKEKDKDNRESEKYIEFYKQASDCEDCPLIFHNRQYYDKRLDISKTFIICMTNLKLFEYYFNKGDLSESKKYFMRSLSKLLNDKDHSIFKIKIDEKKPESFFSYLKNFILSFPLFNLDNQPDLNLNLEMKTSIGCNVKMEQSQDTSLLTNEKIQEENIEEQISNKNDKINMIINQEMIEKIKERRYIENKGIKKEVEKEKEIEMVNVKGEEMQEYESCIEKSSEEEKKFKDGNEIFEFIVSNEKYGNIFKEEINKIIQVMNDIIYTPPYPILFGRISISKRNQKVEQSPYKKEINELFYEGLGLEEFKYNRSQLEINTM